MVFQAAFIFPSPLFHGFAPFVSCLCGALEGHFQPLLILYPKWLDEVMEIKNQKTHPRPNPTHGFFSFLSREKPRNVPHAVSETGSFDDFSALEAGLPAFPGFSLIFLREEDFFSHFDGMGFLKPMAPIFIGVIPTVRSLKKAKEIKNRLLLLGVNPGSIKFFRFSFGISGEISSSFFESELLDKGWMIHLDLPLLFLADNTGESLFQLAPGSKTVRSIYAFAETVKDQLSLSQKLLNGRSETTFREFQMEEWIQREFWANSNYEELAGDGRPEKVWEKLEGKLAGVLPVSQTNQRDPEFWSLLKQTVLDHVMGLGPLEELMRDEEVGEVMVNGPSRLFFEKKGVISRSPKKFTNEAHLRVVIDRIVGPSGRRVDSASPYCDVRLPCGSRVNVILPPLSLEGPVITIRRFKNSILQIEDLIQLKTLTSTQAKILESAVKGRWNIVVAGNSGSGKTTLLNIMSQWIGDEERIITLEDAAELKIQKSHLIRLETKARNVEGKGEISLQDLLINALRMRPDRLILGECRGAEAVSMLQALNTGHDGSMTTLHSNSARDALERLEGMVLLGAPHWPAEVIRRQVAASIQMIVYLKRTGEIRQCSEMVRLKFEGGQIGLEVL